MVAVRPARLRRTPRSRARARADSTVSIDGVLAWLSELHGGLRVELVEEHQSGALRVRIGRDILVVSPGATGFDAQLVGQAGRGRPRLLGRDTAQRQFVDCVAQLVVLRGLIRPTNSKPRSVSDEVAALQQAQMVIEAVAGPGQRLWTRTLRLAILRGAEVEVVGAEVGVGMLDGDQPGGSARLLDGLRTESMGFVVFESVPVEHWPKFTAGEFSPTALALRILTVLHGLHFDFLDESYEDHDLFVRKAVYPLSPKWRNRLKTFGRIL